MLTTNGYVFLDIDDPVCAWGAYRGVLVPAKSTLEPSTVSLWTSSLVRRGRRSWFNLELRLEQVRQERHSDKVSRLQAIYFFEELDSARRFSKESGLKHCTFCNLAEVHVDRPSRERFDLNWITNWKNHPGSDDGWIDSYWRQEPYPQAKPIWECLTERRVTVLGTDLREVAYANIERVHPASLALLEIARIAAWLDSDLGNISPHLIGLGDDAEIGFCMDMRDATNQTFLNALQDYMTSGNPINRRDISKQFSNGTFGRVPDLTFMNARLSGVSP